MHGQHEHLADQRDGDGSGVLRTRRKSAGVRREAEAEHDDGEGDGSPIVRSAESMRGRYRPGTRSGLERLGRLPEGGERASEGGRPGLGQLVLLGGLRPARPRCRRRATARRRRPRRARPCRCRAACPAIVCGDVRVDVLGLADVAQARLHGRGRVGHRPAGVGRRGVGLGGGVGVGVGVVVTVTVGLGVDVTGVGVGRVAESRGLDDATGVGVGRRGRRPRVVVGPGATYQMAAAARAAASRSSQIQARELALRSGRLARRLVPPARPAPGAGGAGSTAVGGAPAARPRAGPR